MPKMKAAIFVEPGRIVLDEKPVLEIDSRTLGELRKHFHSTLQARIVGELAKDLTDHLPHDIVDAIRHA
jgi:protein required for attachment to host cells